MKGRVLRPGSKATAAAAAPAATTTTTTPPPPPADVTAAEAFKSTLAVDRQRVAANNNARKTRVISAADTSVPAEQRRDPADWTFALAPEQTAKWQLVVKPAKGYSNSYIDVKRSRGGYSVSWKPPICVTRHPRMSPLDIAVYKKKSGDGGSKDDSGGKLTWTRGFDYSAGQLPDEVLAAMPTLVVEQKRALIATMKAIRDRILKPLCDEFIKNSETPVCMAQREDIIAEAALCVARSETNDREKWPDIERAVLADKTGKYKQQLETEIRFTFMQRAIVQIAYPEGELEMEGGGGGDAEATPSVLFLKDGDDNKKNNHLRMNDVIALETTPERVPNFHMWLRDRPFKAHASGGGEAPPIPVSLTADTPADVVISEMTRVGWDFHHVKLYSGVDGSLIEQGELSERLIAKNSVICPGLCFKIIDLSKKIERLTVQVWHDPFSGIRLDVPGKEQDAVLFVPANAFARPLERLSSSATTTTAAQATTPAVQTTTTTAAQVTAAPATTTAVQATTAATAQHVSTRKRAASDDESQDNDESEDDDVPVSKRARAKKPVKRTRDASDDDESSAEEGEGEDDDDDADENVPVSKRARSAKSVQSPKRA